jgi:hypothetical protein
MSSGPSRRPNGATSTRRRSATPARSRSIVRRLRDRTRKIG